MATVVKDFKIKSGLIVEGASATVNNFAVLTKSSADQSYITDLVGGSGSSANTADTLVLRDENGDFAAGVITADLVGDVTGNADTASSLAFGRTISISGDATGSVNFNGSADADIAITLDGSFATDAEVSAAQTAAESFATGAANTAETNANTYTDTRETAITTAYQTYADQAEVDAKAYTDTRETAITTAYQSYADTAEADAISTASSDATSKANTAESNANSYTDSLIGDVTVDGTGGNTITDRIATAVADLVASAPETLDTLNELAAALGDDPNFVTTITTSIGEKVAKSGDTMTGDLTLAQDPTLGLHAATKQYVDGEISTLETSLQTYADTAESDAITSANSYTDGRETAITTAYQLYADQAEADAISTAATDATSKANTAESNANTYTDGKITTVNGTIDALTTDDIAEGTNEYYTAEKAQDDVAAAIAAGTHANITITYDDNAGTISFEAENGVADSTTNDLAEGTDNSVNGGNNLYFTDARAVSALEAVVPNFTEVDINSVATQVAATQTVATASQVVGYSFASGTYRSAKFIVKLQTGTHTEVSEVLLTLDSSDNISITEFAVVGTNGSLSTITAGMNGTDVELLVTTAENNSDVTVMGTLLV
jgi:hypothetical protein